MEAGGGLRFPEASSGYDLIVKCDSFLPFLARAYQLGPCFWVRLGASRRAGDCGSRVSVAAAGLCLPNDVFKMSLWRPVRRKFRASPSP